MKCLNETMDAEDETDYSLSYLEQCRYRDLQQMAKYLKLPANVKKIYLVQLIHAKKYLSQEDVENIVQIVKLERQKSSSSHRKKTNRKKPRSQKQLKEISTNSFCMSPPIQSTPKRNKRHRINEISPKDHHRLSPIKVEPLQNYSDRVLRSTNLKTYRKPNYDLFDGNFVYGVIASKKTDDPNEPMSIVRCRQPRLLNACGLLPFRNHELKMLNHSQSKSEEQHQPRSVIPFPRLRSTVTQRNFSQSNFGMRTIGFRRADGQVLKINSLVQKTSLLVQKKRKYVSPATSFRNVEVTVQDIIDSRIDAQTITNSHPELLIADASKDYPNMSTVSEILSDNAFDTIADEFEIHDDSMEVFTVYEQNQIEAGQNLTSQVTVDNGFPECSAQQPLPEFTEAFKKLKRLDNDLTRPLFVNVGGESDNISVNTHRCLAEGSDIKLEALYTFKAERVDCGMPGAASPATPATPAPAVGPAPTDITAVIQPAGARIAPRYQLTPGHDYKKINYVKSESEVIAQVEDALSQIEYDLSVHDYSEAPNAPYMWDTRSVDTDDSIPDLIEDALEFISQDGDYTQRIAMDERMSCILCSWAGPKIVLEIHIRAEHADRIVKQYKNAWNTTTKLSSLVNQELWLSHVVEFESTLYILSLKYEDPNCFMVTLTNLTSCNSSKCGMVTIYNKVTGEPYSWSGQIQTLPIGMPYDNSELGLKLDLSRLELLPNSANLKLVNRELVLMSPSRTVVGKPELDDIHIIIFVNIFDDA